MTQTANAAETKPATPLKTGWGQRASYWYHLVFSGGFPLVWWVRPHWHTTDMGNKTGEVVFITGGNSGTGYETARAYYAHGARVIIGCRSEERANNAIAEIKKGATRDVFGTVSYETPDPNRVGSVEYINLDLGDLDSVERCANELTKLERLNVFYANAGIMAT